MAILINESDSDTSSEEVLRNMTVKKATASLHNNPTGPPLAPCTISSLFEYQVSIHPQNAAVEFENQKPITYAQMKTFADNVKKCLPFQSKLIVPICMDPSLELIASVIGVLSAGAAYVILDPNGSVERNRNIITETKAPVVLTSARYTGLYDGSIAVERIIDRAAPRRRDSHAGDIQHFDPSSPAYLVYTSGTSGKPKGVVISHAAATYGMSYFSMNGRSRSLLVFNPIFSAAQRAILATLCKGGCICLTSKDRLVYSLQDVVEKMKIDTLSVTPSLLSTLSPANPLPSLKQITTVGEPVSASILNTWIDKVEFRVSYGLSECGQLNFSRRLMPGDNPTVIGRPSDTTEAYILRLNSLELADFGEPGELCLTGPQLSDGYFNHPNETAKAFVRNPFGPGRMFHTGDLAVQSEDGNFRILGRIDFQIKINAQRVEPEEVSAVLCKHVAVPQSTIILANVSENKALVAAIVTFPDVEWNKLVIELRSLAQEFLPAYMIPSYWLRYDTLPTNSNGKIDIRQIQYQAQNTPAHEMLGHHAGPNRAVEPVTDKWEKIIQTAWADILGLDSNMIGRHDTFLALGGNSMQAIRMVNQLRGKGVDLGLDALFNHADLASLRATATVSELGTAPVIAEISPFSLIEPKDLAASLRTQKGIADAYPATPLQESLIGLTIQGSTDYLYQRIWDVKNLDIRCLKLAFHIAFLNSDILRTTFDWTETGLIQIVRKDLHFPWQALDSSLEDYKKIDKEASITLGKPLFHIALLNKATLVVSMHHSLFDFWSSTFIYEDVAALYNGFDPRPRPPFKNFIKTLLDADSNKPQGFWESYLSGASQTLLGHTVTEHPVSVSRTAPNHLNQISAAANITPGTLLSFAWGLILSQHLDSNDVTFASTLSGREIFLDQIDRLDGPTLTVVPRRFKFEPSMTIQEALLAAHKDSFDVLKFSQFGMRNALKASGQTSSLFDTMVNILPAVEKNSSRPLNQVFKRLGEKTIWNTEYTTLQIEIDRDIIHFALISGLEDKRAGFILDQMIQIIEKISQNSQAALKSLSIITPAEIKLLSTPKYFPSSLPHLIHEGFENTVRTQPWRTALQWQNEEVLTYRMLDQRANKLARYLQQKGLKCGDFVCLLLEKSPMMIVSILAVLKTGAAYVPMSPENPFDRNAFIIQEARAKALITERCVPQSGEYKDVEITLLEDLDLTKVSHKPLDISISGEDVAYVIFTSGSTGTPKGCVINHAAAASAIESMIRVEGRRKEECRALQFSNYTFDASVLDIFNTINSGGTLCMAPNDRLLSDLTGVIDEMNITHSFFTPTVARLLSQTDCPSLKSVTMGGEPLTDDVLQIMSNRKVIQFYGPTETAVVVSSREMQGGDNPRNLGKPFDTVQAFILERDGTDLVPYGAIGELCIAGPQVGLGYLNRPDLTTVAFTQVPVSETQKIYRSGDLARWLPNGEIECLGRKDNQVKINGYRIELGEIENAILATGIATQCVILVAQINNKPQLAAFIVFKNSPSSEDRILSTNEVLENVVQLRNQLSGLASYMYPKVLLPLSKMPTMPSGKSNRKLLASWFKELDTATLSNYCFEEFGCSLSIIPCTTPSQLLLEKAFTKLLSIPSSSLGQNANFLSLGGDSISAINLSSLMRKENHILSVGDILKYPKLQEMALHLSINHESSLPVREFVTPDISQQLAESGLTKEEIEYIYPCPPGQTEFLIQGNRPEQMWGLMTIRDLNSSPEKWLSAVEKLTQINDILRTTFTTINGQWLGVVLKSPSPTIAYVSITTPSDRETAIQSIWSSRFKFGTSFINYTILQHPSGKNELVTKLDHALYDGTLLRLFASQFHTIQHSLPPPPHTPFSSFASHIYQTPLSASLAFWSKPENRPTGFQYPSLPLTTEKQPYKPVATTPLFHPLNPPNLHTLSSLTSVTIPTIFQAAFTLFLSLSSSSTTPEYDYLYTGRNISLPIPDSINGTCANFLPLNASISHDKSLKEFLTEIQDRFWEVTEKGGNVGLNDIYSHRGLDRVKEGNRALFLFQPFDPAPVKPKTSSTTTTSTTDKPEEEEEEMRYIQMAGSQVKMNQPYALVCEIHKMIEGYKIKFTIDERVLSVEEAKRGMGVIERIVGRMVEDCEGKMSVGSVLDL